MARSNTAFVGSLAASAVVMAGAWACSGSSSGGGVGGVGGVAGTGFDGGAGVGGTSGSGGSAGGSACPTGQTQCGTECVTLQKDPYNCGACGNACDAGEVCSNGLCAVSCQTGLTECAGSCVNTQNDVANCGACGTACAAGQVCSAGQCALTCQAGLTDCNNSCVNLQFDNAHCGACGAACPLGTLCTNGTCVVTCQPGLVVCNGKCTNTQTDNENCGSCGTVCGTSQACTGGTCATSCAPGQTICNGSCTNTQTDNANCGACGNVCPSGQFCGMGTCTLSCAPPLTVCGTACTNTQIDPANCGSCGNACPSGQVCSASSCKGTTCTPGATELCYTGPANTLGKGACKAGTKTCNSSGTGYGACVGEVLPQPEVCGDGIDNNCDGIDNTITTVFAEDFSDNNAGWTLGPEWAIGAAVASTCASSTTGNDPGTDHSATADNGLAGVLIGACYPTTIHTDYCLTSPAIDISAVASPYLSYWRHLHTDYPNYITSKIEVSSNGGASWTSIYSVPSGQFQNDAQWTNYQYNVNAYKSAQFRVRWCYSANQGGIITGGGWSVDDVTITDGQCL